MSKARMKLAVFVILFTLGIALCLVGILWLTYLGIALILLSGQFSSSGKKAGPAVLVILLAVLAYAGWHSWNTSDNTRMPLDWGYWCLFAALWLLGLAWEGWHFRRHSQTSSRLEPPDSTPPCSSSSSTV